MYPRQSVKKITTESTNLKSQLHIPVPVQMFHSDIEFYFKFQTKVKKTADVPSPAPAAPATPDPTSAKVEPQDDYYRINYTGTRCI